MNSIWAQRRGGGATRVIARNPANGGITKQSRNEEPMREIAAVAALPRNDVRRKNPGEIWATYRRGLDSRLRGNDKKRNKTAGTAKYAKETERARRKAAEGATASLRPPDQSRGQGLRLCGSIFSPREKWASSGAGFLDNVAVVVLSFALPRDTHTLTTEKYAKAEASASHPVAPLIPVARRVTEYRAAMSAA